MLAMWLATVFGLSETSRAISWLLLPLASCLKISSSRSVRAARMATAAIALVLTGMSCSRMRCRSLPAIFEDSTDSPAAVALTALVIASTGRS
jgi:hypothetical protein